MAKWIQRPGLQMTETLLLLLIGHLIVKHS